MKAGIYRTTKGDLYSVRKDRTIAASSMVPHTRQQEEARTIYVSSRRNDEAIVCDKLFEGEALRWADLPSGCQNHVTALALAIKANNEKNAEALGLTGRIDAIGRGVDGEPVVIDMKLASDYPVSAGKTATIIAIDEFAEVDGAAFDRFAAGFEKGTKAFQGLTAATKEGTAALKEFGGTFSAVLPGYRVCHAQSARKHRKQGHHVIAIGVGKYAWAVSP